MDEPIGQQIKRRRRALRPRVNQTEFAKESGIDISSISKIEAGFIKDPGWSTAQTLLSALDRLEAERAATAPGGDA